MIILQSDIMARFKESTADLHSAAEQHPFQQAMIQGTISRAGYANYLGQMLIVHGTLESHLRRCANLERFHNVVRPHHYREHLVLEDLESLGANVDSINPLPATRQFLTELDEMVREETVAILGFHYVLEGSTNGSKFIAKSLQRALGFEGGRGTAYLNPHQERQRDRWAAFKEEMSALDWSEAEMDVLVGAAKSMFGGLILISQELSASERP